MKTSLKGFVCEDEGQDLIEYALLAAFIARGATLAMTALGSSISSLFSAIGAMLKPMGAS